MAPRKRGIEEIQESPEEAPQRDLKTQKTDAKAQAAADSNSDSSYVSAAAAVFSENEDSEDSASSHDQSDSELSTSSEEPSSDESESEDEDGEDDDEEDRIINVRPGGKPQIRKEATDSSLLKRLKSFLPEMHEANEELEKERADGTLDKRNIEDCDEGKQHIEMNLGLGVLKEKRDGDDSDDSDDDSMSDGENEQRDVMQKLMGERSATQKGVQIQEVGDG